MKEQVLNPSDRAALQGLIPLAGALGAGTIFALFFGGRRRGSGIAVFELFAIVAVLVSVGTTAYLAISLLHQNEAIDDQALTQTATPLIFAVFLLVLVSVLGRLPGSAMRIFSVLPLVVGAALIAAWLASSSWSFEPGETVLMAVLILGVGGLAALLAWGGDRLDGRWERRAAHQRFVSLSVAGYRVADKGLNLALPGRKAGSDRPTISCWTRKDRVYLDWKACRQLQERTEAHWDRLAEGKGRPPGGPRVLTRVHVSHYAIALVGKLTARFWTFEPGADEDARVHELEANADKLFDVTELGIV
ncbi:MAG TPA: hypothetical protein VFI03_11505 [Solirubrobacterales bacterium]|nr:hypothetical protein [Solirubrobacterales bacterium]